MLISVFCTNPAAYKDNLTSAVNTGLAGDQPRLQGHLSGRGEKIDDPGKGCQNLQDSWRFSCMRRQ